MSKGQKSPKAKERRERPGKPTRWVRLLAAVPTDIRSCAPFGSQHKASLTPDQTAQWDRAFQEGRGLERAKDFAGALSAYQRAGQIDDSYADLAFCTGRCLEAHLLLAGLYDQAGQKDEAKKQMELYALSKFSR